MEDLRHESRTDRKAPEAPTAMARRPWSRPRREYLKTTDTEGKLLPYPHEAFTEGPS